MRIVLRGGDASSARAQSHERSRRERSYHQRANVIDETCGYHACGTRSRAAASPVAVKAALSNWGA
jgi:hypothetical protein